jgi:surfactin synthase thioesterase subunit
VNVADGQDPGAVESELAREYPDADLVHKLVHACMVSERISEDEELRILEAVLR